jgi:hypothetical protein
MHFRAMIHSQEEKGPQQIEIIDKIGDNKYICRTPDGIKCHAIFNLFSGLYYADDIYGVISE